MSADRWRLKAAAGMAIVAMGSGGVFLLAWQSPELPGAVVDRNPELPSRNPSENAQPVLRLPENALQSAGASLDEAILMANENFARALQMVENWPAAQREAGYRAIAYERARSCPSDAVSLANRLPSGPERDDLLRFAFAQWGAMDFRSALAEARGFTNDALRSDLICSITASLADSDPIAAAKLALAEIPPGPNQSSSAMAIIQRWVQSSPDAAASWIATFPEGDLQRSATENLVHLWARKDEESAGKWADSLPPGAQRDIATGAMVDWMVVSDPQTAAMWATAIDDDGQRRRHLLNVATAWIDSNREAASEWLKSADLSEDVKSDLLAGSRSASQNRP